MAGIIAIFCFTGGGDKSGNMCVWKVMFVV